MPHSVLYLASSSPRRQELLSQLGYQFKQVSPNIPEVQHHEECAQDYVKRLAQEKAQKGLELTHASAVVLGADTLISFKDRVFEKPKDKQDFISMMQQLSGQTHQVLTAIAVATSSSTITQLIQVNVRFCTLTELDIQYYWETQEPQDKAGGYAIQGIGGNFVESIQGSYSAVVGLPLVETRNLLAQHHVRPQHL
tara:strand:+ start:3562 stop:4146 length:585 start_codon:yes stop_codon:yes gene_type:complete